MKSKNYLSVGELQKYSTLTTRQIRNNINSKKSIPEYENFIKGGGRGRGGQYWIHTSIIHEFISRKRNSPYFSTKQPIKNRKFSELFYSLTKWTYFGCVRPNSEVDFQILINSLQEYTSFYVIHRKGELNHIHFTLYEVMDIDEVKSKLKGYFCEKGISLGPIFLIEFSEKYRSNSFDYLLRRGRHNMKSDLVDWGFTTPRTKEKKYLPL